MKTQFIKIRDISEIDPSKATVYDLHKRYIDDSGNMYGLKYNRQSKKIEITKIIRTPAKTASYYQQKMMQSMHQRKKENGANGFTDNGTLNEDFIAGSELEFNPGEFINKAVEVMKTHKDRLTGITMNIKNSKVIPDNARMEQNTLEGFFRNIDIDGIRRIDKILDNHKELTNYPRSLPYYQAKLDNDGKNIYDLIGDDERRMTFIFYSEMYFSIYNLYKLLTAAVSDLEFYLSEKDVDEMKHLSFAEKQQFHDAIISVESTKKECEMILKELKKLKDFISKAENF